MPEQNIQNPEFQPPEPSRLQRLALRAAGILLRKSDAAATLHAVATEIGGFEVSERDNEGQDLYKAPVIRNTGDMSFRSMAEHQDILGRDLAAAAERTVSGGRVEGPMGATRRGRMAKWLAGQAMRGAGAEALLKDSLKINTATAVRKDSPANNSEELFQDYDYLKPESLPYSGEEEKLKTRAQESESAEVKELLLRSSLRGKPYDSRGFTRRGQELAIRHKLADIYETAPETAAILVDKEIMGFHGTKSVALADILEQGALLSAAEANARGLSVVTGEHLFQPETGQRSISFSSLAEPEHALTYAGSESAEKSPPAAFAQLEDTIIEMRASLPEFHGRARKILQAQIANRQLLLDELKTKPDSLRSKLYRQDFPVLLGVSREGALKTEKTNWQPLDGTTSDYAEFRAGSEEIPLSDMVVAVPRSKLDFTRQLFEERGFDPSNVIPIEDLQP